MKFITLTADLDDFFDTAKVKFPVNPEQIVLMKDNTVKGLKTAVRNMKSNEVFLWAIDSKNWEVIRPHQI